MKSYKYEIENDVWNIISKTVDNQTSTDVYIQVFEVATEQFKTVRALDMIKEALA